MSGASGPRLRVGCVQYLNARPLIAGWDGDVLFDHPAALCDQLAAGTLDVALVSSFEFLRAPIYTIVDGVSISADGEVFSVFVACPGEFVSIGEIEIDPASLTSINLLRCLLKARGLETPFVSRLAAANAPILPGSGRLLIGDQAIRFRQEHGDAYRYLDLGAEWKSLTGLPFVFALWLVRPEVAAAGTIAARLRETRDHNVSRLRELADTQRSFDPKFAERYWREHLSFALGENEKRALLTFRSQCESHGLIERGTQPRFL